MPTAEPWWSLGPWQEVLPSDPWTFETPPQEVRAFCITLSVSPELAVEDEE